jgi:DNA-nicking Smr family endonuclease
MSRTTGSDAPIFDVHDDGLRLEGVRPGFERMLAELRRGEVALVDRIDLHGQSADQARGALHRFCRRARGPHRRAVLVVHGKGIHSPGGRGILRDEMATWLTAEPLAQQVLCFCTARPEDGGAGALYVLLAPRG